MVHKFFDWNLKRTGATLNHAENEVLLNELKKPIIAKLKTKDKHFYYQWTTFVLSILLICNCCVPMILIQYAWVIPLKFLTEPWQNSYDTKMHSTEKEGKFVTAERFIRTLENQI